MSKRRIYSDLIDVNVRDFEVTDEHDFDTYVAKFLAFTTSKNRSKHTVKYYEDKLRIWRNTLESLGITTDISRDDPLSVETIEAVTDHYIRGKSWKYSAVAAILRAVKAFANYLRKTGVIDVHGFDEFVIGKGSPAPLQTFKEAEVFRLLAQTDPQRFAGLRDYVIILTFLETGVRLRELCDLSLSDVDMGDRVLSVYGKNQTLRYVPFQANYASVLRQYLKVRGRSDSNALFITQDDERLNGRTIQQRLKRYGKQASITDVRVSPHTFRHTFAKWYVKNGGDPFSLQTILGHTTMDMVRVYVNMYGTELDEAHRKFSPLKNILK